MPYAEQSYDMKYSEESPKKPKYTKKSKSVKDFLKTVNGQKLMNLAKQLGFTVRGVTELIFLLWVLFDSDSELTSTVMNLLKQLKGVDGLNTILKVLKLVPDKLKKKSGK